MKVTLVTQYKGAFPFINELSGELQRKGVEVIILDIIDMLSVRFNNNEEIIDYHLKSSLLRQALKAPVVSSVIKEKYYGWDMTKCFPKSDHLSIHFIDPQYRNYISIFRRMATSISAVVWGSDFYRANKDNLAKIKPIFDRCDSIIIGNTEMASDFVRYYGKYSDHITSFGFGIAKLRLIEKLVSENNKESIKRALKIPNEKLIVTVGYNGIKAQQHLLILNALGKLPEVHKENIFILIPFGYGGNKMYKEELESELEAMGLSYRIFDDFLSDDDVARIRISTDLVINAQITDASSASLQEHLFSGNVLLVGDWLPYKYFRDNNIRFWTFTQDSLIADLTNILNNFEDYSKEVKGNKEKIFNLSSWDIKINQWLEQYSA